MSDTQFGRTVAHSSAGPTSGSLWAMTGEAIFALDAAVFEAEGLPRPRFRR